MEYRAGGQEVARSLPLQCRLTGCLRHKPHKNVFNITAQSNYRVRRNREEGRGEEGRGRGGEGEGEGQGIDDRFGVLIVLCFWWMIVSGRGRNAMLGWVLGLE